MLVIRAKAKPVTLIVKLAARMTRKVRPHAVIVKEICSFYRNWNVRMSGTIIAISPVTITARRKRLYLVL